MKPRSLYATLTAACLLAVLNCGAADAQEKTVTVLFGDQVVKLDGCLVEGEQLWVAFEDVAKVNGFQPKPEGLCAGDICIPIPASNDWQKKQNDRQYLNVTRMAARLDQAVAVNASSAVWSFGRVPALASKLLPQGQAPDFELPDRTGKTVRLSDFRGKKVLILSWASW